MRHKTKGRKRNIILYAALCITLHFMAKMLISAGESAAAEFNFPGSLFLVSRAFKVPG